MHPHTHARGHLHGSVLVITDVIWLRAPSRCAVIGRGGEQINKIQQESGCKVQIAPGEYSYSNVVLFVCTLLLKTDALLTMTFVDVRTSVTCVLCCLVFADSGGLPDRSVSLTGSHDSIQ